MTMRAVVVGINDYTGIDPTGNSNLSCCVSDETSVADLLQSFGFDSADIVNITDREATRTALLSALSDMVRGSRPGFACLVQQSGLSYARTNSDQLPVPDHQRTY